MMGVMEIRCGNGASGHPLPKEVCASAASWLGGMRAAAAALLRLGFPAGAGMDHGCTLFNLSGIGSNNVVWKQPTTA